MQYLMQLMMDQQYPSGVPGWAYLRILFRSILTSQAIRYGSWPVAISASRHSNEFFITVQINFHHRILEALAYDIFLVSPQLPLYPPWKKPRGH